MIDHPEFRAFVQNAWNNPGDDTNYLACADWLDERETERAAGLARLIRAAIGLKHYLITGHVYTDSCDCRGCRAERTIAKEIDTFGFINTAGLKFLIWVESKEDDPRNKIEPRKVCR